MPPHGPAESAKPAPAVIPLFVSVCSGAGPLRPGALRHVAPDGRQQNPNREKGVEKRHLERLRRARDRPIICSAFEDAFRAGASQAWICRIETGDANPTLASLRRIARTLDVEVVDLLQRRPEVDRRTVTRCLAALEARGPIHRARSRPQRTLYSLAVGASPAQVPTRDEETAWESEPMPLDDGRAIALDLLDPTVPDPRTGGVTPLDLGQQTPKRRPDPARPIPPDWGPGARVLSWAAKQGIARDWVQDQVEEFVTYWTDTGSHRTSWDATFIQRLQTLQARTTQRPPHEPTGRLADKDYARGATPLDRIPWLLPAHVA